MSMRLLLSAVGALALALLGPTMASALEYKELEHNELERQGLAGLPGYPNAKLVEQQSAQAVTNYPVLRNRISKIRGRVRSQKDQWVNGTLSRRIYEIPTGHSSEEAFVFYQQALQQRGVNAVFACSGRSCGPSNLWANDVFDVAYLYGYDSDQHYQLAQQDGGEYFVLYTVTRGNRKSYALLDHLRVAD